MNWDAVGALSELVAAITVIASLIYLALQVRDNTRSSRSATRQSISDSIVRMNMIWPNSTEFTQVFRDHVDEKPLNPVQTLQLSGFCYA